MHIFGMFFLLLTVLPTFMLHANEVHDVATHLYKAANLKPVEPGGSRCGGGCGGGMCAAQPNCTWTNVLTNIRVVDFINGKFSNIDESDVIKVPSKERNSIRLNCSESVNLPSIMTTESLELRDFVHLQQTTTLKNTKSKDTSIDIGTVAKFANIKFGEDLSEKTEFTIGNTSKQEKTFTHKVTKNIQWQPIKPREGAWLKLTMTRSRLSTKFNGDVIVDADWHRQWRVIRPGGALGRVWNTINKGPLSNTLIDTKSRMFNVDMIVNAEGGTNETFYTFSTKKLTDDDCPVNWPEPDKYEDILKDFKNSTTTKISNKTPLTSPDTCSASVSSKSQSGQSLDIIFNVNTEGCPNNHYGTVDFQTISRDITTGDLLSNSGYSDWSNETADNFHVDFQDSSYFGGNEELIDIDNITTSCYCYE